MSFRPALWIAGGLAIAGAISPAPEPEPSPTPAPEKSPALARVGTREISAAEFENYLAIRNLSGRIIGGAAGLEELCERTVWVLAARDANLEIARGVLEAKAQRRKLVIAAGHHAPRSSPSDRAHRLLAEAGVSDADFLDDVEAELLASGAKHQLNATFEQLKQKWPIHRMP